MAANLTGCTVQGEGGGTRTLSSVDFKADLVFAKPATDQTTRRRKVSITSKRTGKPPRLQLNCDASDPLLVHFGLDAVEEGGRDDRRGLTLALRESVPAEKRLIDCFREGLDKCVLEEALAHRDEWFSGTKNLSDEAVKLKHQQALRDRGEGLHTYKLKVKCKGAYPTNLYRSGSAQSGDYLADLERGARVTIIFSMYEVWFMSGGDKFGVSSQAEKIIITPAPARSPLDEFVTSRPLRVDESEARRDEPSYTPFERERDDEENN